MSSQFLSMHVSLGRCNTHFRTILRPCSPDQPPPVRARCTPFKFKCLAAVPNSVFPLRTAEELQDAYGCQGMNFFDIEGTTVADLKLENGCRARLVLRTAHITSYKAHMWHGGEEEMLHTVRSRRGKLFSDSLRGGVNLRLFDSQDPLSVLPRSTEWWSVEDVRCEPSNYAQITLTTSTALSVVGVKDMNRGCLQLRYVVTLTDKALSSAVIVTNTGLSPVEFKGSIVSHLAVGSIEGAFIIGLHGCSYLSLPSPATEQFEKASDFFPPSWGSETKIGLDLPATSATHSERTESVGEFGRGRWIVENEDYAQLRGAAGRLYSTPPSSLTVLDRGLRRSLIVERLGFQEFWVWNPGPGSKLRDWDKFLCVGTTQNIQSVVLLENEQWRAAQTLGNPGYD